MDWLIKILVFLEFGCALAVRYYPAHPDNYYNPKPGIHSSDNNNRNEQGGPLLFQPLQSSDPSGDPLFLTPLIEDGKIAQGLFPLVIRSHNDFFLISQLYNNEFTVCVLSIIARAQSLVTDLPGFIVYSHTGYITVNKQYNSNLYFWFILAEVCVSTLCCLRLLMQLVHLCIWSLLIGICSEGASGSLVGRWPRSFIALQHVHRTGALLRELRPQMYALILIVRVHSSLLLSLDLHALILRVLCTRRIY